MFIVEKTIYIYLIIKHVKYNKNLKDLKKFVEIKKHKTQIKKKKTLLWFIFSKKNISEVINIVFLSTETATLIT